MSKRITIDPITRIEGHLRIDVEVDNNAVSNAWASCTMWRGIEKILRGRDPRDAWLFTRRFCGVCTTVHAMASVRAVEEQYVMVLAGTVPVTYCWTGVLAIRKGGKLPPPVRTESISSSTAPRAWSCLPTESN